MADRDDAAVMGTPGLWVPATFFVFAGVLAISPLGFRSPVAPPTSVPAWATDTTPVRQPLLRPEYSAAVYKYRCSDCHKILPSPEETDRTLTQHREIRLLHGMNTRCFNCHHRTNRDAFVDDFGNEIPYDQPQLLCARCHGTVYRDWQHGSHGRTNGFWNTDLGPQTRRRCIECHDPHHPPFPPMHPAPGPGTLRSVAHSGDSLHADEGNPLQLRRHSAAVEPGSKPQEGE